MGHESMALTFTWAQQANCDTFTFGRYRICWNKDTNSAGAPSAPDEADGCVDITDQGAGATTEFVHRSDMDFGARIFACEGDCETWWGGDAYTGTGVNNDAEDASTHREHWVLEGVYDASDPYTDSDRVIDATYAVASAMLYYPSGSTYGDKAGFWYHTKEIDTNDVKLWHMYATSAGWLSWNTTTDLSTPVMVGEGIANASGVFGEPGHPWVVAEDVSSSDRIRMFFQTSSDGETPSQIYSVISTDDVGDDFGLRCAKAGELDCDVDGDVCAYEDLCDWEDDTNASATPAELAICSTDAGSLDEDCFYLTNAAHGRLVFDYLASATVDFGTDEPLIYFTGNIHGDCDAAYTGSSDTMDDQYVATWSTSSQEWSVPTDDTCAQPAELDGSSYLTDLHDPGIIPLPDGQYKVYVQEKSGYGSSDGGHYYVCYSAEGGGVEDCALIQLAFDDGSTWGIEPADMTGLSRSIPDLYACLGNIDTIVRPDGGGVAHGAFLKAQTWTTALGTGPKCFDDGGIVFAELRN